MSNTTASNFLTAFRPEIIAHFKQHDPQLHQTLHEVAPHISQEWRIKAVDPAEYFSYLTREIVYQQLSGKAASTIFGRFQNLVEELTPGAVLSQEIENLRSVGLSRAKATYVQALAQAVQQQQLDFANFPQVSDTEIITQLTQVKGIGQWTAEMFLMFAMGRENVFSHGDLGLRKGVAKIYGLELGTLDKQKLEQISSNWHPYKTYASCILWASLDVE